MIVFEFDNSTKLIITVLFQFYSVILRFCSIEQKQSRFTLLLLYPALRLSLHDYFLFIICFGFISISILISILIVYVLFDKYSIPYLSTYLIWTVFSIVFKLHLECNRDLFFLSNYGLEFWSSFTWNRFYFVVRLFTLVWFVMDLNKQFQGKIISLQMWAMLVGFSFRRFSDFTPSVICLQK